MGPKPWGGGARRGEIEQAYAKDTIGELKSVSGAVISDTQELEEAFGRALHAARVQAGEAETRRTDEAETDLAVSLELLVDEYGVDRAIVEKYRGALEKALSQRDVGSIALDLRNITGELYDQLPEDGSADGVFQDVQAEPLKKLPPPPPS